MQAQRIFFDKVVSRPVKLHGEPVQSVAVSVDGELGFGEWGALAHPTYVRTPMLPRVAHLHVSLLYSSTMHDDQPCAFTFPPPICAYHSTFSDSRLCAYPYHSHISDLCLHAFDATCGTPPCVLCCTRQHSATTNCAPCPADDCLPMLCSRLHSSTTGDDQLCVLQYC